MVDTMHIVAGAAAYPVALYLWVWFLQKVFAPAYERMVEAVAQVTMIRELFSKSGRGVLNSGYSADELEEELDQREEALSEVESKMDRASKRRLSYLQDAQEAGGEQKMRYWFRAKKEKMKEQVFSDLHQRLMKEHMFLSRVDMESFKRRLEETGAEFGFDIAIEELPEDEMIEAIEEDSDRRRDVAETIEEIERALEIDGDTYMEMDFSDVKADVDELSDPREMEEVLDQQIEAELEQANKAKPVYS